MNASPFLKSLCIPGAAESVFDLSSDLAPISIRDQIVRASVFVDHLAESLEIKEGSAPFRIVVAGGGVAGAVCVIRALARRFHVVWLEKNGNPFTLQLDSDRWISPFFYEWPWGPWWVDSFPVLSDPVEMAFSAGISCEIARDWSNMFSAIATDPSASLVYKPSTSLDNYRAISTAGPIVVNYTDSGGSGTMECDALVIATGAGKERAVGRYKGHSFWVKDPFRRFFGQLPPAPRILISGGGDGALQDFVRICTGIDDAASLYGRLCSYISVSLAGALERDLRAAELQSRFSTHLRLGRGCAELTRIEGLYDKVADLLAGEHSIVAAVENICAARSEWTIDLLHSCSHSSPIYGINRLLAGLIRRTRPKVRVLSGKRVVDVSPKDPHTHACGDPDRCFGILHEVYAEESQCAAPAPAGVSKHRVGTNYHVVVVRHGLEPVARRNGLVQQFLPPHPLAAH